MPAHKRALSVLQARLRALISLALSSIAACDRHTPQAAPAAESFTTRDSAGVAIIESKRPRWQPGDEWTIAEPAALSIGSASSGDAAQLLHAVVGAARLENGNIVVALGGTEELRFFDSTGTHLRSAGRAGQGPGEFSRIGALFRIRGDTLITHDGRNIVSVFDAHGRFVRSRNASINDWAVLNLMGAFSDGTLVHNLGGEDKAPRYADGEKPRLMTPTSDGRVEVDLDFMRVADPPSPVGAQFARGTTYAALLSPNASRRPVLEKYFVHTPGTWGAVGRDHFYFGDARRFEVLVYTSRGELARVMRVALPPEKIPESAKTDTATFRIGNIHYRAQEVIWPDVYPAHSTLIADSGGNVWARQIRRAGASLHTDTWTVLDNRGALLGNVTMPAFQHIFEIGACHLLALVQDDLGVERVVLHALRKPGTSAAPQERCPTSPCRCS